MGDDGMSKPKPPMIAWQEAGEPGWPFHWPGGPLPGTINYVDGGVIKPSAIVGEQLALDFSEMGGVATVATTPIDETRSEG